MEEKAVEHKEIENLAQACRELIAKSERRHSENQDGEIELFYLPLSVHLLDCGSVMGLLFDHRLSSQEKALFRQETGSDEGSRKLFVLAGMTHDFGKATAAFQGMIHHSLSLPDPARFPVIQTVQSTVSHRHDFLGMLILLKLGFSQPFASVCGSHHGKTQAGMSSAEIRRMDKLYYEPLYGGRNPKYASCWQQIWEEMSSSVLAIVGIEDVSHIPKLSKEVLLVLSGWLSAGDRIASNSSWFPLLPLGQDFDPKEYGERVQAGWKKAEFPEKWRNADLLDQERVFQETFGFPPNTLQKEVISDALSVRKPGLMIIEAPMGMGKTEAALEAANIFSSRSGSGGVFIGLPTQATANGLLDRFLSWSTKEAGTVPAMFRLMHSASRMNESYIKLPTQPKIDGDNPDGTGNLFVHKWMQNNYLGLFSDFVIGTVDQILMSALDHRYVSLRQAAMAGKTIIIDEVHAYDEYMTEYLDSLLTWLGALHTPVILLSATLSSGRRTKLVEAYLKGEDPEKREVHLPTIKTSYPSVVWTDADQIFMNKAVVPVPESVIRIDKETSGSADQEHDLIVRLLKEKLEKGGNAGVVVNTVKEAQCLSEILKKAFPEFEILTVHSNMTMDDRKKAEQELISRLGKKSIEKKSIEKEQDHLIVVGTQVIEQSLDIDFDYMISQPAPVDLLLQRAGRLHRHSGRKRSLLLESPEFVVLDRKGGFYDPGSEAIYTPFLLERTMKILPDQIRLPQDVQPLIEEVYRRPELADLSDKERRDYEDLEKLKDRLRSLARLYTLDLTEEEVVPKGINGLMKNQAIRTESDAQASVRLIDPSLEVILIKEQDGMFVSPDHVPFPVEWIVGHRPKGLSENELERKRISITGLSSAELQRLRKELEEKRNESPLRSSILEYAKEDLILVLNDQGEADLGDLHLKYDPQLGLIKNRHSSDK